MLFKTVACFLLVLAGISVWGQPVLPIGSWGDHFAYHRAIAMISTSEAIVAATPNALFKYFPADQSIERISKVNGLHEASISAIGYSNSTDKIIVGYSSGGIDLISGSSTIYIPFIRTSAFTAVKKIFHINHAENLAYLSTGFGIVVLDVMKAEIFATYLIGDQGSLLECYQTQIHNGFLYAGTSEGLKRANLNSNLQDFRNWVPVNLSPFPSTSPVAKVLSNPSQLFIVQNDSILVFAQDNWSLFYRSTGSITHLSAADNSIFVTEKDALSGRITVLSTSGTVTRVITDAAVLKLPVQSILYNNEIFVADSLMGLLRVHDSNLERIVPSSPYALSSGESTSSANKLAFASNSSFKMNSTDNFDGLFVFTDRTWYNYNGNEYPILKSFPNVNSLVIDDDNDVTWAGSTGGGLLKISKTGNLEILTTPLLQPATNAPQMYNVNGLALDKSKTLWISNSNAAQNLVALTGDGAIHRFAIPFLPINTSTGKILINSGGYKYIIPGGESGLIVFNDNNTLTNPADDQWKWYREGQNRGNLPNNNVLSIAEDKDGFIWVGTAAGIGVIQCPEISFSQQGCDAFVPVVQRGNFLGRLFDDQRVQAIAVDGENRKWIGTTSGVYLISSDGEKTIHQFTTENSPLPSDTIYSIAIESRTGEVFFSTSSGIVSYRSTATEVTGVPSTIGIFPNPVPPGYQGTIAFRNLPGNSIVRVTEMNGRVVYQTRTIGGQATWNGSDITGRKISSGVYLVLVSKEGSQAFQSSKIVFIRQ